MKIQLFALLAFALVGLSACGGGDSAPADATATDAATTETAPAAEPAAAEAAPFDGPAFDITIKPVGDEMKFETTEFEVKPGQTVNLTFENTATMATMEHNVVVLMSADDIMAIGQGGASAPDNDYIPADMADKIIAHTSMSAPGETVSISFDAPLVPGEYPFICTFPGHFMTMKGVMRVVA